MVDRVVDGPAVVVGLGQGHGGQPSSMVCWWCVVPSPRPRGRFQIIGSQTKDTWSGDGALTTNRKLRISGQADLTPAQAQEVASTILREIEGAQKLDSDDIGD